MNRQARLERPDNNDYLECCLPVFLQNSVTAMKTAWERLDSGENYLRWDCDFCELQTDINNAEVNGLISTAQAWHLRKKYLRLEGI